MDDGLGLAGNDWPSMESESKTSNNKEQSGVLSPNQRAACWLI